MPAIMLPVVLKKHVRTLHGGSQPHLMQAADGNFYVVKFQNNPQGTRVLANEMLAAKMATVLGLPVPSTAVVELSPELSEDLYFETPGGRLPIRPGLHFGSQLVVNNLEGRSYDCLPRSMGHLLRNPEELIGIQLFDLWTCNRDTRQTVFWKYNRDKKYTMTFIDNGHCFGGPQGKFNRLELPSSANLGGTWMRWLDRIATFPIEVFEKAFVGSIPPEWCDDQEEFARIFKELRIRQSIIQTGMKHKLIRMTPFMDTKFTACRPSQVLMRV